MSRSIGGYGSPFIGFVSAPSVANGNDNDSNPLPHGRINLRKYRSSTNANSYESRGVATLG